MVWVLGGLAVLLVIGAAYVSATLSTNGPALLSAADRVIGGDRGTSELANISTGPHPAQKLHVWGPDDRNPDDAPLLCLCLPMAAAGAAAILPDMALSPAHLCQKGSLWCSQGTV